MQTPTSGWDVSIPHSGSRIGLGGRIVRLHGLALMIYQSRGNYRTALLSGRNDNGGGFRLRPLLSMTNAIERGKNDEREQC
jgi:hypothetical protein